MTIGQVGQYSPEFGRESGRAGTHSLERARHGWIRSYDPGGFELLGSAFSASGPTSSLKPP
jgi:hypothetical protein